MTTKKRPYAQPNAQRRSIYTDDETWAKLKELGKGNASAGIRIAALHHGRLVEVLRDMLDDATDNGYESICTEKARALLASLEAEKGDES